MIVAQYADDMLNGHWDLTHQGIAFNTKGELIDGQHRLAAIVKAGVTVKLLVNFDVEDSSHMDGGLKRSVRDALWMSGMIGETNCIRNKDIQATIGFMVKRSSPVEYKKLTAEKRLNVYNHYSQCISTLYNEILAKGVKSACNARNTRSSAIAYAMLCALYAGVNYQELRDWFVILRTGDPFDKQYNTHPWHHGVILFRRWLVNFHATTSQDDENEVVCKAMSSISNFVNHQTVNRLSAVKAYEDIPVTREILFGEVNG